MVNLTNEYNQPVIHAQTKIQPEVRLTSSELANLWASWMESSIKECIVKYFLTFTEDQEIRDILEYTLGIAQKHLQRLSQIYEEENHPIPRGFTDDDINLDAPRLFTDSFILAFLEDMAKVRLDGYSTAMQMSTRADVRKFFTECVADPAEIYNRVVSVMLSKGIYMRPPHIPVPEKVDFVKKQSFLTGYLGKRRPIVSVGISHVFSGLQTNSFRKGIFSGFAQVTDSKQVRQYMERGKEISSKHAEIFGSLLMKEDLPVTMPWDSGITESRISPFSDRLMMQKVWESNSVLIGSYGKAFSVVLRNDLSIDFVRLMMETAKYAQDGLNILIDNGWLEEPPQSKGRNDLH